MATETFSFDYAAGVNIYFRLWNVAGQVFDFSDNTFKAIGSATTPYVAATERADMDGTAYSSYTAAINLANVNSNPQAVRYVLKAYNNATPASADVAVSDSLSVTVQAGFLGELPIVAMLEACFTSSVGTTVRFLGWLERGGQTIVLASGSIAIAVREQGAGSDLFSVSDAAPNALGRFECEQASPGFTSDRVYAVRAVITVGSYTFTTDHALQVQAS